MFDPDELEKLLAKATPGEWRMERDEIVTDDWQVGTIWEADEDDPDACPVNDAALIVALHNAAPALIAAARERDALRVENERLREALPRMERVQGNNIDEWRRNLSPELYRAGDAVICWVNEGDLIMNDIARVALKGEQP